jgi:transposase
VDREQAFLVPPSMLEWLPAEHPVFFVIEVIRDLSPRLTAFRRRRVLGGAGRAAYDPMMLVTLLVYASWQGVRSARQIEARCHTDVAFRIICAQDPPDHSTIARFRKVTAAAFVDLFAEVLLLCAREGMGRFGKVAIDGTKVAANASRSANTTLARLRRVARDEVDAGLAADADPDPDVDGPPPPGLRDRSGRRERLARVRAELEAEQAAAEMARTAAATQLAGKRAAAVARAKARYRAAQARQQAAVDEWEREHAQPLQHRTRAYLGPRPAAVDRSARVRHAKQAVHQAEQAATADETDESTVETGNRAEDKPARRNLTDPDSRIMPTRNGWVQGYNLQAAVTEDHLIVGVTVTNTPADVTQGLPMLRLAEAAGAAIAAHTGRDDTTIGTALLDAGYDSEDNLTAPGPDRLIATTTRRTQERAAAEHPTNGPPPPGATPRQAMRHRLQTPEGIRAYRRRGAIVEPIFGHLKDITGLRRFLTRGLTSVTGEVNLATATLNLRRLYTYTAQA